MTSPQAQHPLSAGARVAGIPELLEQILLEVVDVHLSKAEEELEEEPEDGIVGLQTLLLSQRTAQAFRDTITDSPAIRRALFGEDAKPAVDGFAKANPLIHNCDIGHELPECGPFQINVAPVYDFSGPYSVRPPHTGYKVKLRRMYATRSRIDKRKRQGKSFPASWRQMHLFSEAGSAPVTQLELKWISERRILEGRWENPTLGEVIDQLMEQEPESE